MNSTSASCFPWILNDWKRSIHSTALESQHQSAPAYLAYNIYSKYLIKVLSKEIIFQFQLKLV